MGLYGGKASTGSDCCDRWMSVRDLLAVPSLGLRLLTAPDAMPLADRRSEVRAAAERRVHQLSTRVLNAMG